MTILIEENIRPNVVVETDRFESAVGFVHLGLGYAIIPRFYYQSFHTPKNMKIRPNMPKNLYPIIIKSVNTRTSTYIHFNNAKIYLYGL